MLSGQRLTCILSAASGKKNSDFLYHSAMGDLMGYIPYTPLTPFAVRGFPGK